MTTEELEQKYMALLMQGDPDWHFWKEKFTRQVAEELRAQIATKTQQDVT